MSKNTPDQEEDKQETPEDAPEQPEDAPEETPENVPEDTAPGESPEQNPDQVPGENQDPNAKGAIPPEEEGGFMRILANKIGFGYIALIILIAVVLLFGFRSKILHYFSGENETEAPKPTIAELHKKNPIVPSAHQVQTAPSPAQPSQMQTDQSAQQPATNNVKPHTMQPTAAPQETQPKPMTKDSVKMIVKDFILNNPEVIMESLTKLEKKANEQKAKQSQEYLNKSAPTMSKGKPFIGNKNGTIRIVEFFDYRCIHCNKVYPKLIRLTKAYPNLKIALIPLPFMGAASTKATRFSLAVNSLYPNKFRAFHSDLIKAKTINDKFIFKLIKKHKLNKNKLIAITSSDKIDRIIKANLKLAQKSGVQGVPSFVINGEFIPGAASYNEFKKKIDMIKTSG